MSSTCPRTTGKEQYVIRGQRRKFFISRVTYLILQNTIEKIPPMPIYGAYILNFIDHDDRKQILRDEYGFFARMKKPPGSRPRVVGRAGPRAGLENRLRR
jgi:hypothetical protein